MPRRGAGRLLVATWNVANFGLQQRRDQDRRLIAEMVSWFDLVAVQEVRDNFGDLEDVCRLLGRGWRMLFSDVAGNNERMAFLYDSRKVRLLEKVGEIGIPPNELRHIRPPGVAVKFQGFDRNPYLAAFQVGQPVESSRNATRRVRPTAGIGTRRRGSSPRRNKAIYEIRHGAS